MTAYRFDNGDIRKGFDNVGWFGPGLNNPFDCLVTIKNILESHGHTVNVQSFKKEFEIVLDEPYIREVETGYQLWLEVVGDNKNVGIYIEDGVVVT